MATDEKITTSLEVDVTQFKKGLSDASRAIRLANSEFDAATAGMGKWSDSADGLRAKLSQLDKTLGAQEDALSVLRAEYDRVVQTQGEGSKGAEELAIKINKQEAAVKKTKSAISKYNSDLENLDDSNEDAADSAKEVVDSFSGIADGAKKAASAAGTLATNLVKVAGKTIVTGLKAVATAAAGVITAMIGSAEATREYRTAMGKLETQFENLGWGAETGTKTYQKLQGVLGDTDQAVEAAMLLGQLCYQEEELAKWTDIAAGVYGTFGASLPIESLAEAANETAKSGQVTGALADALNWLDMEGETFGVTLRENTEANQEWNKAVSEATTAEDYFNLALQECSDNQERAALITETLAWQYGNAADVFKSANAEVIRANEANEAWTASMAEIGGVVEPIVSDVKLMAAAFLSELVPGVKEAATAFRDLFNGEASGAEKFGAAVAGIIQQLIEKFASAIPTIITVGASIITSLVNGIITAAPSLASGVGQIVQYFTNSAPQMLSAAAAMIQNLLQGFANALPSILATGGEIVYQLLNGIITRLPDIASGAVNMIGSFVSGLQENLPKVLEKGSELVGKLGEGIKNNLPELVDNALDIIMNFAETIYDNFPTIIDTGFELLTNIVQGIMNALPKFIEKAPEIISKFANTINDNFPKILKKGVELILEIIKGIIQAIPTLIKNIPKIITAIVDVWEAFNWLNLGKKAITFMKDGILKMVSGLKSAGKNVLESVTGVVKDLPGNLKSFGSEAIKGLGNALKNGWSTVKSGAVSLFNNIVGYFKDLPSKLLSVGKDLVKGLWNGISDMTGWIIGKIEGFGDSILGGIKDFFGINSPSKLMEDEVGAWIPRGMANGITGGQKYVDSAMLQLSKSALGNANAALSGGTSNASGRTTRTAQGGTTAGTPTYVFNQYNSSPKALSRAEIYRQTKNQLRFASATT